MSSTPITRRNDSISAGGSRPNGEIHPPPSKDLPYANVPKRSSKARATKDNLNVEELRFRSKLLGNRHQKSRWNNATPFYKPIGASILESQDKKQVLTPVLCGLGHTEHSDLSQDYQGAYGPINNVEEVGRARVSRSPSIFGDFKLMIRNCFHLNPAGTPMSLAGIKL